MMRESYSFALMAAPRDRQFILVELDIHYTHPALLEGLDNWLRLGLISDECVRSNWFAQCRRFQVLQQKRLKP